MDTNQFAQNLNIKLGTDVFSEEHDIFGLPRGGKWSVPVIKAEGDVATGNYKVTFGVFRIKNDGKLQTAHVEQLVDPSPYHTAQDMINAVTDSILRELVSGLESQGDG